MFVHEQDLFEISALCILYVYPENSEEKDNREDEKRKEALALKFNGPTFFLNLR